MREIILIFLVNICCIFSVYSQEEVLDYGEPTNYEIASIRVEGNEFTDSKALISISGLSVGSIIKIPGDDIPNAFEKLWKLRLFTDIQIKIDDKIGDVLKLVVLVKESPRLADYTFSGIKKSKYNELEQEVADHLLKGSIVTENTKVNTIAAIKNYFIEKGFLDVEVSITERQDSILANGTRLLIDIDKGKKIKIDDIIFTGNRQVKSSKLKKYMASTNTVKNPLKSSKFIEDEYEADKAAIIAYYNTLGYRDATIVKDSTIRVIDEESGKEKMVVMIEIDEGQPYYFRDIKWKGNSLYTDEYLSEVLGIKAGDIYNEELLQTRLNFSPDGRDINSLYMDNGYLFFKLTPIEVAIDGDAIDLEIRIYEGTQATIGAVNIEGNELTNEEVIRREIRTQPGQKFSRSDIIRSQREIISLGYFNPESLGIGTDINQQDGTVDITYTVEEKRTDKLELSAGFAGSNGVVGTAGVVFNNFSIKNVFNKEAWRPLPMGDGQSLSFRAQSSGRAFQSINASFTEPWLGGKKPMSFTVGSYFTRNTNGAVKEGLNYQAFTIGGISASFGTRLKWPDDFFVYNTTLAYENFGLTNYEGFSLDDGTPVSTGNFHNFSLTQTISRNSIDQPIFPTKGSRISISAQITPPYSLFSNDVNTDLPIEEQFKFVEYQKLNIRGEWYTNLFGKFVLKSSAKIGLLGKPLGSDKSLTPFERFELGGNGLNSAGGIQRGKDFISARGYDVADYEANAQGNGAAAFNKFAFEVRYPFYLPGATVYGLAFVEGSNAYTNLKTYNPFDLKRSAGIGFRAHLPMFGTIGVDYGLGFDKNLGSNAKWTDYGTFNIVLGFEPE